MGICQSKQKYERIPKNKIIQIGGVNDGLIRWIIFNGQNVQNPQWIQDWQIKLKINSKHQVSGNSQQNSISGIFEQGNIEMIEICQDGTQIKYDGLMNDNKIKLTCHVIHAVVQSQYKLNDIGECQGSIQFF